MEETPAGASRIHQIKSKVTLHLPVSLCVKRIPCTVSAPNQTTGYHLAQLAGMGKASQKSEDIAKETY
jgi:hypothetical protein